MTATVIYWTLQIAIWIACIFVFIRRKQNIEKHNGRKDSRLQRVFMVIFIPVFAFGYACLGGYPPKDDQVYFILVVTVLMYGVMFARWIRQNRKVN
jgi:hypothetical protein